MACNSTCLNHYGTLIGNRTLQINLYHCCAPLTTEVLNIMFKCYTTDKHRAAITWTRVLSIISSFSLIFQPWFHAKSTTRQPINTHFVSHSILSSVSRVLSDQGCLESSVWQQVSSHQPALRRRRASEHLWCRTSTRVADRDDVASAGLSTPQTAGTTWPTDPTHRHTLQSLYIIQNPLTDTSNATLTHHIAQLTTHIVLVRTMSFVSILRDHGLFSGRGLHCGFPTLFNSSSWIIIIGPILWGHSSGPLCHALSLSLLLWT